MERYRTQRTVYAHESFCVDNQRLRKYTSKKSLSIREQQFKFLKVLLNHPEKVITISDLIRSLYNDSGYRSVTPEMFARYKNRIQKSMIRLQTTVSSPNSSPIETIADSGYILHGNVRRFDDVIFMSHIVE